MEQNKTVKYFKYAIGEIILVMIGILLALQVNNWNELRKQNIKRDHLIGSLIEDFKYNEIELTQEKKFVDSILNEIDTYNQLISSETQLVSVDSLRKLARSYFRGFELSINLSTYSQANSTGNLSLLNDKILIQEFTKFIEEHNNFNRLLDEGRYNYFNGSAWELRKTIDINLIRGTNTLGDKITYLDYKSIINTPLVKAALNNIEVINYNIIDDLNSMEKSLVTILDILETMKTE